MVFSVVIGSYTIASETLPTFHWREEMELGLGRDVSTLTEVSHCEPFHHFFLLCLIHYKRGSTRDSDIMGELDAAPC